MLTYKSPEKAHQEANSSTTKNEGRKSVSLTVLLFKFYDL